MIQFKSLALRRGAKLLFSKVDLQIYPGEHVGLVGDNGSGKTSLFAMLRGELSPDSGDVEMPDAWRVAHVAQHAPHSDKSAAEFAIDGDERLRALEAELKDAEDRHDGEAAGEIHGRLADHDAYTVRSRAETLLAGLGFTTAQFEQPVNSFSGGWRMRLALAQTLMQPSDMLLLDEPTNHLDLDAIVWLEDWLRKYAGTILVISHDRDFLDAVCNAIVAIDPGQPPGRQIKRYGGNYSTFEVERDIQATVLQSAFERQQQDVERLQGFIARFKAKASKAKQAQSRVKALERMEKIVPAHAGRSLRIQFAEPDSTPDPLIVVEHATCGYPAGSHDEAEPEKAAAKAAVPILFDVDLELRAGQRIGLLGANGQGKSTLIKTLVGELELLGGEIRRGKGLAIGYFAQYEIETLRGQDTPLEHLTRFAKKLGVSAREQEMRDFLGRFDFPGPMATAPIAPLSGGEKARLALAVIVFAKPNLLLLDEPTNHLDLETREALTIALAQFDGTLVVVSHDRHLLRSTAEEFWLVADGVVRPYDGDLDDYRKWLLDRASARRTGKVKAAPAPVAVKPTVAAKAPAPVVNARDQQRQAAQRKPIEKEISKLEGRLETLTAAKATLDARLADEALYLPQAKSDLQAALKKQEELAAEISQVEEAWVERQEALNWVR
ncbi:ATP-binding cassette domain-containing protein [soil metagenome]